MSRLILVGLSSVSAGLGTIVGLNYDQWKQNLQQLKVKLSTPYHFEQPFEKFSHDFISNLPLPIVSAANPGRHGNLPTPASGITEPSSASRSEEIMRFGFPGFDNIRTYGNFVVSYNNKHRTANWVFEHLTKDHVKRRDGVGREDSDFKEDSSIHPYFRSSNLDYRGSGFDRGHLAAAGNHHFSQKCMDETFVLSNISPQVGVGFNRDSWNQLEKFVRQLTKNVPNVYVCTGPLYLPKPEMDGKLYVKYQVIGKNNVAVPTHFFKVIVVEKMGGEFELLSFVMPNQVLPADIDLRNYLVPLDSIERASGFLFFENLPKHRLKKINGK